MIWLFIIRIRQRIDSTIATVGLPTTAGQPRDDLVSLIEALRRLLCLHRNDIELHRLVKAEECCLSFEDLHNQQPGLGVRLLGRANQEDLQQLIEPLQIELNVTQPRRIVDLR